MGITGQQMRHILQPPIEVKEYDQNSVEGSVIELIVPGYMVMFVFFVWISIVNRFHTKENRVWWRV